MGKYFRAFLIAPIVVLWLATFATANEKPSFVWHEDLEQAWEVAQSTQRPLLIFVKTNNCTYCRKMEAHTLQDETVQSKIHNGFVPMSVQRDAHPELMRRLRVRMYPTTIIIAPEGKVVDLIPGYLPPSKLTKRLKAWENNVAGRSEDEAR